MSVKDLLKLGDQVSIRMAKPQDAAKLSEICLLTGDSGSDASDKYQYKEMLGDFYLRPYLEFEGDLVFVLVKAEKIVGYAVGALDTYVFADSMNSRWLPGLRDKYGPLVSAFNEYETKLWELIQEPFPIDPQILERYPSHMHIDLVSSAQGSGYGRSMVSVLLGALISAGSRGVHLGMSKTNQGAGLFYEKVGFRMLSETDSDLTYGRRLTEM
jgi:ribosomal protein S18 acetylase RimI-like enzyme